MIAKVLILGPSKPAIGGIRTNIDYLMNSFLKDRFKILRFNSSSPYYGTDEYFKEKFIFKIIRILKNYLLFIRLLHKERPRLIHINTSFRSYAFWRDTGYIFISKYFKIKIILQIHGGALDEFLTNKPHYIKRLALMALKIPLKILVLSAEQAEAFNNYKINKKPIIVPNMICVDAFDKKSDFREIHMISKETRIITFIVAHFYTEKGIWEIMKSIPLVIDKVQNVLFIMVGGGGEEENLKKYAFDNKIDKFILFTGHLQKDDVVNILNASDLFIFPTYYSEGFPMVILEAMASGLPIISTPIRAISEIIKDEVNGFLIPPKDHIKLSKKILALLLDDNLRKVIGQNNKQKAKNYDASVVCRLFECIYYEVLNK